METANVTGCLCIPFVFLMATGLLNEDYTKEAKKDAQKPFPFQSHLDI